MFKLYNTWEEISTKLNDFILKVFPNIKKTQLNFLPTLLIGMITSNSSNANKVADEIKKNGYLAKISSIKKRIKRFFVNKFFDPYSLYDKIIRFVISTYKNKHPDKRVHIAFDHMFSRNHYTVFMISIRIGKQGIPLWFRCFKDIHDPEAFSETLLIEGITYVSNLFPKDYKLIFLADRWFNSSTLLKHIMSLNHTFNIRFKGTIKVKYFDKKEGHYIIKTLGELISYKNKSIFYNDVFIYDGQLKVNVVISKSDNVKEPWIIVTNGNPKRSIKDYAYRFGSIENLFKNQKSNGFDIETTVNATLPYFTTMYTLTCICILLLTLIGAEVSKNFKSYKHLGLETHMKVNGVWKRVKSLFHVGLEISNLAINSKIYIRLPIRFVFYDI